MFRTSIKQLSIASAALTILFLAPGPGFGDDIVHISGSAERAALAEVIAVKRRVSHTRPWYTNAYYKERSPGFYISDNLILASRLDIENALSFTVKNVYNDQKLAASVVFWDREMRVAILKLHRPDVKKSAEKSDEDLLNPGKKSQMKILDDPELMMKLGQIKCVSLSRNRSFARPVEQTIFLKGVRNHLAPGGETHIPSLLFSGWEPGIQKGDLLVSENTLIGIVISFNREKGYGYALPGVFVHQYMGAFEKSKTADKKSADLIVEDENTTDFAPRTIINDPGFQYSLLTEKNVRAYYKVKDGARGVLVTRTFAYGGAYGRLIPGDVVLSLEDKPLGPGGSVRDNVLGALPLGTALLVKDGYLRPPGGRVRLRIARKGIIRDISIKLSPFTRDNYWIPPRFKRPSYLILGGLVFVELSAAYVAEDEQETNSKSDRLRYLVRNRRYRKYRNYERYVILERVLPLGSNRGYDLHGKLLISSGGIAVKNLSHLRFLMEENRRTNRPLVLNLEGNREIVLNPAVFPDADEEVRQRHGIQFMTNLTAP